MKMSGFLQLGKREPVFSGFLGVTPSPRNRGAASGKMITDKHPRNLNSALGMNFFRVFFQGFRIDLYSFSHD